MIIKMIDGDKIIEYLDDDDDSKYDDETMFIYIL